MKGSLVLVQMEPSFLGTPHWSHITIEG